MKNDNKSGVHLSGALGGLVMLIIILGIVDVIERMCRVVF